MDLISLVKDVLWALYFKPQGMKTKAETEEGRRGKIFINHMLS